MTRIQKEIQQKLQIERQLLSVDVRKLEERERSGAATAVDVQVHKRHRVKLASIERALNRLEKHTFGVCQSCGDEIDSARLNALPYAEQCIDCQRKLERKTIGQYANAYSTY